MPITINGSGTVTGISAGGLPDDCITTAEIAAAAVTTAKLGTSEASGLAKAWVNFNGTGTVAIRASFNVSSITDNGVGDYTVNFTTALADANYAATFGLRSGTTTNPTGAGISGTPSTTQLRFGTAEGANVSTDYSIVCVAIFR
jgi:hypothetical protein